jgi:hypothetical protein
LKTEEFDMALTREQLREFRVDFKNAMALLEEVYGGVAEIGSITYSETGFHTQLKFTLVDQETGQKKVDEDSFAITKRILGFAGNLGDKYICKGIVYTVTDLNRRRPKYAVSTTGSDGKSYKASVEYVNRMLKIAKVE